jgi:hypothetical protein
MGPGKDPSTTAENQATRSARGRGCEERVRRPRRRACLLKGCERRFRPGHPLTRYCSRECREEARRWREWKARHRYRQSEGGKQKRRAQSRRYRMRRQRAGETRPGPGKPREGHRKKNYFAPPAIARVAMRSSSAADLSTPSGRLMFQIIGAMAEFERALIQERVRAGLKNARAKGGRLGRPPVIVNISRIADLRGLGHS